MHSIFAAIPRSNIVTFATYFRRESRFSNLKSSRSHALERAWTRSSLLRAIRSKAELWNRNGFFLLGLSRLRGLYNKGRILELSLTSSYPLELCGHRPRGCPKSVQKECLCERSFDLAQNMLLRSKLLHKHEDCFIPQRNAGFATTFLGFWDSPRGKKIPNPCQQKSSRTFHHLTLASATLHHSENFPTPSQYKFYHTGLSQPKS